MFAPNSTQPCLTPGSPSSRTASVIASTALPGETGESSTTITASTYAPRPHSAQRRASDLTSLPSHTNVAAYLLAEAPGEATAWIDGTGALSYANLRAAVGAMMDRVAALGLDRGEPVAVLAANGTFWIASYLAILASGMVAVPLPTALDAGEIARRASWARCGALLVGRSQSAKAEAAAVAGIPVLEEEDGDAWARGEAADFPVTEVDPDADAAYLFTSGTTGDPRAVRITHENIRANTDSILGYLELAADDRMLVVLPFTYVFGASLLHTHLRAGASLVDHPSSAFPETIVQALADHACTGMAGVPSVYNLLVRGSTFTRRELPALRHMQQAGGALSPRVLRELVAGQPHARLFVMYGQTEATARLSYLPPEELLRREGSIGRGIPGVALRVLDEGGADVAPGEVGEIVATGRNISPGYLDDPAASARKMSDGVLRTGDLGTVDADGFIYVVDRAEDFIKSWGYRIASTDVEAAAMELPGLIAAAAVGLPDERSGERVEMVVVTGPDQPPTTQDVIRHCRERLAAYMVPARVHIVDALPVNANGKVVKRSVRELCIAASLARASS